MCHVKPTISTLDTCFYAVKIKAVSSPVLSLHHEISQQGIKDLGLNLCQLLNSVPCQKISYFYEPHFFPLFKLLFP